MSTLLKMAATGNIGGTGSRILRSIVFQPGTAASTLDLRLDGSGGAVAMTMAGPANGAPSVWRAASRDGVGASQPHVTLSGLGQKFVGGYWVR
jgi:hypothetical protein